MPGSSPDDESNDQRLASGTVPCRRARSAAAAGHRSGRARSSRASPSSGRAPDRPGRPGGRRHASRPATRRWIREMEVPPAEQARIRWAQARTAAAAGTAAWQNGTRAREGAQG